MKIQKFRIKNYKSIIDSGDCYLSEDGITILAGKNEVGKTAILEALRDFFDIDRKMIDDVMPLGGDDLEPEIVATFIVTYDHMNDFLVRGASNNYASFSLIDTGNTGEDMFLTIKKSFSGYSLVFNRAIIEKLYIKIENGLNRRFNDILLESYEAFHELLEENKMKDEFERISNINILSNNKPDNSYDLYMLMVSIIDYFRNLSDNNNEFYEKLYDLGFVKALSKRLVSISGVKDNTLSMRHYYAFDYVFFGSSDDKIFPNKIDIPVKGNNGWSDALKMVDVDLKNFDKDNLSTNLIRDNFSNNAKQLTKILQDEGIFSDNQELAIDYNDSGSLEFSIIEENGSRHPFSFRSPGFRWFFSLWWTIKEQKENRFNNFILIDEPDLHLHATAQKEILGHLEELAKKETTRIIFSTHSPYLIGGDKDKLKRVKIVTKGEGRTKIDNGPINKVLSYSSVNEVTYLAFDLPTDGYYLELYEYLRNLYEAKEGNKKLSMKNFDKEFFFTGKGEKQSYPYKGEKNQVSIYTYMRNSISHSAENPKLKKHESELKERTEKLIEFIKGVRQKIK